MLNIDEYNESLYRSIDKRNKRKNIIQNYSGYLAHATQEENHLEHHKYLYKEGENYVYPEDLEHKKKRKMTMSAAEIAQRGSQNSTLSALKKNKENLENKVNDIYNKPDDRKFTSKLMEKKEPNQINVDEEKKKYQEYQKAAEEHDKNKAAIQLMADVTKQEKKNKKEESKKSTLDKVTEKPKAKSISTASAAQVKVKRSAKHSAFDISDEEMNNYLMHGSVNGLKSVETEKPSEESEDQKKKQ